MMSKPSLKEPKDLGLKIGSRLERFWTEVRDAAKTSLEQGEYGLLLQKEIVKLAEEKIKLEQDAFKKQ